MIIFNELEFAERMSHKGFIERFSIYELSIYAKWLKYLKKSNKNIENELIDFSKKHYGEFNYQIHFDKIDKALKSIEEYRLRIPIKTVVTKVEWESICKVEDERYRRVLFIMLVVSKYYKNNNTKIAKSDNSSFEDKYCCWLSDSDICKLANVTFKPVSCRDEMFCLLREIGLVDIVSKRNTYRYLNFVDNSSETLIEVLDYGNIIWYYERQLGGRFGECKECGKLFRQNKVNNAEYCKEHRGYRKVDKKNITCVDCGIEFEVDGNINKKIRCNVCQYRKTRENTAKRVNRYRNNVTL